MRKATSSPVLADSKAEGAASFLPREVEQAEAISQSGWREGGVQRLMQKTPVKKEI